MDGRTVLKAGEAGGPLIWCVVFGLLAVSATVVQAVLLGEVASRMLVGGASLEWLASRLSILLCAVVARAVFVWVREVAALRGAARARERVRGRVIERVFALGPALGPDARTGGLVTTAVDGVESLGGYFARYLPQVYLGALVPALISACVLYLDPVSGLVLVTTGPAIPVLMVLIGRRAEDRLRLQQDKLADMGTYFLDLLRGLPTLKAFGRTEAGRARVEEVGDEFGARTLAVLRVAFVSGLALEFIATVSVALVAVLLAVRLLFADLSLAVALPVLLLAPEFYRPLRDLGASRHAGMEGQAAAGKIGEILALPTRPQQGAGPERLPRRATTVELSNVGFAYPDAKRPALSGVDLVLPAGTRTVLVGVSGAGKSTLVDLLARFAEPLEGGILAGGARITDLAPEDWRQSVALVPQSPYLFHGTVLQNLRLARPDAGHAEVEEAARLAGAREFVGRLPEGYDTMIGERGARLSEGEVRRLAIARALLKDAPLLVMDEPASGLDPESERHLGTVLERLGRERTVLVVAHRLGAARHADQVAVLERGSLVEKGTHDALILRQGPYARLVSAATKEQEARPTGAPPPEAPAHHAPDPRDGEPGPESSGGEHGRGQGRGATLVRLLGFLTPQRGRVAVASALGTWTMAANVGLLAASAYLVSAAALKPPLSELIPAALIVQILGTSRGVSRYLDRLFSHEVTFGLLAELRAWLYGRLVPLSPARLVMRRGGDLLSRLVADVDELENVYLGVVSPFVSASLVSALTYAILYPFVPRTALLVLVLLAFAGVGAPLVAGLLERGPDRREVGLRGKLGAELAESVRGIRDLAAFGRSRDQARKMLDLGGRLCREQERAALSGGLREGMQDLSSGVALWAVLSVAGALVLEGSLGAVYLALLAVVALAGFEAVRPLGETLQSLGRSLAAGERLFEVSDSPPTVTDPAHPLDAPTGHALGFHGVTFRYGEDETPVLTDVSFSLTTGKKMAVVGPSGAGKSTLVNLLLRFWDPMAGGVRLDGEDLRSYAQSDARAVLSVAAQDAFLFDESLRNNLLLARPSAEEGELWSALETAQLGGFVAGLPRGLDTPVGELGTRLSGGESRRLSAARALLKDAPFLVLDEPTADLDAETERRFMEGVHQHADGRGLLLITHRLVGMEKMDEILVLDGGRVVERGTHEGLMTADGPYARMVGVQEQMLVGG